MVSIITAVYNSEKFIDECIESVKAQTFSEWEHVIVDDCSTDSSAQIVQRHAGEESRIRYFKLSRNQGPGVARNKAIREAKGRFIAFLDIDDLWYPQKLEKQIQFMKINQCSFTFSSYDTMNADGQLLGNTIKAPGIVTYKKALLKNPIGCLTVIYDTEFFGKQYMPAIRKRQDFALWLNLLKKSDAYGIQEPLAIYRIQKNSVSSNKLSLVKYEWQIYRNVEGLSIIKSIFYVMSAIMFKLKSYF